MRRRRVADASCRGHEPNVRQTRCRRGSQRVMASRLGFKRWGGSVRGPGAEPSPCRTERTPERSYDALGPRYRRAWKPPFLPRPFMAIDNRYFRSVRVALNVTSGPQIRRYSVFVQDDPLAAFYCRRSGCFSCCRAAQGKSIAVEKLRHRSAVLIKHEQQLADRLESAADVHITLICTRASILRSL